jgi:DNA (cytosine-5)-methyltransferase 1
MTTLPDRILSGEIESPDLFCGGTPCQAFSVAGLRNSLDDARGNLSLTFVGIANAIDTVRVGRDEPAAIIFWENVPGVLSTKDNAFGCFLAGLAGEDNPLEPPGGKWTNAGYVLGPKRAVAWRLLDAQYFGVAQRRKRVFVVASARADFDPAAVLFEFDGVRRDTAPSREAGQSIAGTFKACASSGGWSNSADHAAAGYMQPCGVTIHGTDKTARVASYTEIAGCPRADVPGRIENSSTTVVQQPIAFAQNQRDEVRVMQVAGALAAEPGAKQQTYLAQPYTLAIRGRGDCHNLEYRQDGTANALLTPNGGRGGIGVGAVAQPIIGGVDYENNAHGPDDVTGPLLKGSPTGGGRPLSAIAFQTSGYGASVDPDTASTMQASYDRLSNQVYGCVTPTMAVRRLTPVECERLQGFPDNYTNIPWRKKEESPDGPRYKALGNSWAVPNVRWIGQRIKDHLAGVP